MIFIIALVLSGLYLITSTVNLVFIAQKRNNITKTTNYITIPLLMVATIFFLIQNFPDSKNILRFYTFAIILIYISTYFFTKKITKSKNANLYISNILFILSNTAWLQILLPSFRLCPMPVYLVIILIVCLTVLITLLYFNYTKKFNILIFILFLTFFSIEATLFIASILTIITQLQIYSLLYFVGIILLIIISTIKQKEVFSDKKIISDFLSSLLFTIYITTMSASTILMLY